MNLFERIQIKFYREVLGSYRRYAFRKYQEFYEKQSKRSFEKVKDKKTLTPQQREEVLDFYRKLTGREVSLTDHAYFYSRTGVYSKEYMPKGLYQAEILGRANRLDCYNSYADKNLDEVLLPGVKHPRSILKNINWYYYFEGRPVSKDEAVKLCQNLDEAIIKPSLALKGDGVRKISIKDGVTDVEGRSVEALFDYYEKDFLIQEAVRQHERMRMLNPTSVNTMRIMTYRSGMEVLLVYAVVRIGRMGQVIDNQSAGGISAKVNEDGTLGKYAFGVAGDDMIEKTDSGVVLDGYAIPSYERAVETVKKLHYNLPLFDLVGWDVAIDEGGEPVLIEWNGRPGPSQTACGTGFGDLTERIVKEVWPRKNTLINSDSGIRQ